MSKKRTEDSLELENDLAYTGPVQQRKSIHAKSMRSRTTVRRKVKETGSKSTKVGGIHQRSNKRANW